VITDAGGVPLLGECTPANVRDEAPFVAMLDALPPVRQPKSYDQKLWTVTAQ